MRILFKRRMYPRTCDVPVTFLWRICDESVFLIRIFGVSRHMCYVRVTYVWCMKRTRDVSTTYALRSILIHSYLRCICRVPVVF